MAKLEIIVDYEVDKARKEAEKFNDELERTEKQTDRQNDALKKGVIAFDSLTNIARQAADALKQVYSFAREGAELLFLESRFENLAISIGSTADALLDELNVATKGTLSDMEAMALTTDLVGLGLANDATEAVRLAKVMSGLNMNTNQLTLTLTNMTTMRFDALGVRVDGFKERLADLKDQGLDTDDAFKEAFLQQAEEQLLLVGDAAESSLGTFKRLEASFANVTDQAKKQMVPAFEEVADALATDFERASEYNKVVENLTDSQIALYNEMTVARDGVLSMEGVVQTVSEQMDIANSVTDGWSMSLLSLSESEEIVIDASQALVSRFGGLLSITKASKQSMESYESKMSSFEDKTESLIEKIAGATWQYGAQSQQVKDLKQDLFDLGEEEDDAARKFEENTNMRILKRTEEMLAVDGLTVAEEEFLLRQGLAMGVYTEDYVRQADEIIRETESMIDKFNALDGKQISVRVTTFLNSVGVSGGGLSNMPGFAKGTDFAPGGAALVGERGPEIVNLPRGSQVIPNNRVGSNVNNITLVYSPAVSIGTQEEAENILMPFVERGIRNAQSNNIL